MMRMVLPLKAILVLVLVLPATPRPVHGQERLPFTLDQIAELLAARLAPGVILEMARADCLAFRMDVGAEGRLRAAGAADELITGLRGVCYRGPEPERQAQPETPAAPSTPPSSLRFDPGSAALRSLAIPGLGQFYTGRPAMGAVFLTTWAGALGVGLMSQKVTVECLARVFEEEPCPSGQVRGEVAEQPLVVAGVGAAVAVAIISALEARSGAKKANARQMALNARPDWRELVVEMLPPPEMASGNRLVLLQLRRR